MYIVPGKGLEEHVLFIVIVFRNYTMWRTNNTIDCNQKCIMTWVALLWKFAGQFTYWGAIGIRPIDANR